MHVDCVHNVQIKQKASNFHSLTIDFSAPFISVMELVVTLLAWTFLFLVLDLEACFFYSSSNYKQLGLMGDDRFYYSNYWRLPEAAPEDAEDEAVMLIGGTIFACTFPRYLKRTQDYFNI